MIKKILVVLFVLGILILWIIVGILNSDYLLPFMEYSFYWLEFILILYFVLKKKLFPFNLFNIAISLTILGGVFALFGLYAGEVILRTSLVVWLFAVITNLFEHEKQN